MKNKNQYSKVVRPNVWFEPEEDLKIDDYLNTLKQKMKQRIFKGEFIKSAVFYVIEHHINPFNEK